MAIAMLDLTSADGPTAPNFLVRFPSTQAARTVGVGFVVGERHVVTCAHVVNVALGRDPLRQDKPDEIVTLRLPMCGDVIREARVDAWLPPPRSGITGGDIAGLVITGERLPPGLRPAHLSLQAPSGSEVRLFGYPDEVPRPEGGWVICRLQGEVGNGLLQLDSDPAAAWRAQPGYSGTPVLDRAGAVVAMFKAAGQDDRYRDSYAIASAALQEAWDQVPGVVPPCPYKRLIAFDEDDHDVFFGRENDVRRLKKAVQSSPLVLVVGPSGVGKSSLVQAGLLPELRKTGAWTVTRCRPGSKPLRELAAALLRAEGGAPDVDTLRRRVADISAGGLANLATDIHIAQRRRLLVVVDQLEELFTAGHEPAVVEQFLDALLGLPTDRRGIPDATLVATMRADFYDRLLAHPDAAPRLDGRFVAVSPLGADELRRVVEKPAQLHDVAFAPGLVDRIVREARHDAGVLPLLEFTLSELWPRQHQRVLTHEAYEEIGGLEGSLRAQADAAITTLVGNGTSEVALRGALLTLISRTGDRMPVTRRACLLAELPAEQRAVIFALVEARLVIADTDRAGQQIAELAHESLIRVWPRLAKLAEDDAAFIRWRGEMEQWQAKGYGLLPAPMIAEARRWCEDRPDETRSLRDLVERSEADQHRQLGDPAHARARSDDGPAVPGADDRVVKPASGGEPVRLVHDGRVNAVVFSPDGGRVATASDDKIARVFDATSGAEQARLVHDDRVHAVVFSPDGTRVATASGDGYARVFDSVTGNKHGWLCQNARMNAAVFSLDGTQVITASSSGRAYIFDSLAELGEPKNYIDLSRYLLADWTKGTPHSLLKTHLSAVIMVAFSPDGARVATASDDQTAGIFYAATRRQLARLNHNGRVNAVLFSPDGAWVATASSDRTARVFQADSGAECARLVHDGPVTAVAFSPDGTRVATASGDRTARVFDGTTCAEHVRLTHDGWVNAVAFSPDGAWVATASADYTARVFDADSGAECVRLVHDGPVTAVAFSPDGTRVVTASGVIAHVWSLDLALLRAPVTPRPTSVAASEPSLWSHDQRSPKRLAESWPDQEKRSDDWRTRYPVLRWWPRAPKS